MRTWYIWLVALFIFVSCDLNEPQTTEVTIIPRLEVVNGTSIPETDSVDVKLWSTSKVWYEKTLPWSAKSVTISGIPVGTAYTISLAGRSKLANGSQFVFWNGSQSGTATDAKTVDARTLTVPVTVYSVSHDSTLYGLWVSHGVMTPSFSKSILSYEDTVENSVSSVTVLGTTLVGTNVITYSVDGGLYTNNGIVNLTAGTVTTISVKVTNANGNSLVYTIAIYRNSQAAVAPPTNSDIPWQTGISYGSVTHGGQTYKTVVIGTQTWMAENLNYAGPNGTIGVCYNNSADSCAKYGRLYTWAEVMQGSVSSSASPSGVQGICPDGWHVPSDGEWRSLEVKIGMDTSTALESGWRGGNEGNFLKSKKGWSGFEISSDKFGFRALPSGNVLQSIHMNIDTSAAWWSATDYDSQNGWYWNLTYNRSNVASYYINKNSGFSLRCIKNETSTELATPHDSTLSGLTLSSGTLLPSFSKSTLSYSDTVSNTVQSITLTATTLDTSNRISYSTDSVNFTSNPVVALTEDSTTTIYVRVTNANGNRLDYRIQVYRKAAAPAVKVPHDSTLSSLSLTGNGTLRPSFNKSILSYNDTVESSISEVTVNATTLDTSNRITYSLDSIKYTSNGKITPTAGSIVKMHVRVLNVNGNQLVYTVNVYRKPMSGSFTDNRDGQVYKYVTIGSNIWMAQNLNYVVDSSGCPNNSDLGCLNYGRLYSWTTAMGLSTKFRDTIWGGKLPRQGVCPDKWHLPTDNEWELLMSAVGGSGTAGTKLKANSYLWQKFPGTDNYEFGILPAGYSSVQWLGNMYQNIPYSFGSYAYFWSSTEYENTAWGRYLGGDNSYIVRASFGKYYGYSVRCVKNEQETSYDDSHDSTLSDIRISVGSTLTPAFNKSIQEYTDTVGSSISSVKITGVTYDASNNVTYSVGTGAFVQSGDVDLAAGTTTTVRIKVTNSNGYSLIYTLYLFRKMPPVITSVPWQTGKSFGSVVDSAGQIYKTITIGTQTWMAENLNYPGYDGKSGICYENTNEYCTQYGRLYTWSEAMDGATSNDLNLNTVRGICPFGWHVPNDADWNDLYNSVYAVNQNVGSQLKSTSGWSNSGNGLDAFGFRALPNGYFSENAFLSEGALGLFWSASTYANSSASTWSVQQALGTLDHNSMGKNQKFGLRCLKN